MDFCECVQTSVVGRFKSDSRHGWLHSRNPKTNTQKNTIPNESPELITKQGFHEFTPNLRCSGLLVWRPEPNSKVIVPLAWKTVSRRKN